ncbi:MAG: ABC transporter permease, partial [bacterium]
MSREEDATNSPARTPASEAWRRLRSNRAAMAGLVLVLLLIVAATVGPWLSPYDYYEQNFAEADEGPSRAHLFGTDELGRDQLTRVLYGARISLAVGVVASLIALFIGVTYGGISGYFGGNVDSVMMRIIDLLYGIPLLLFVILLMVLLGTGLQNIFIALGAVYWLAMARIVRGQILSLKTRDYVQAARALGAGHARLILLHLLPNTLGPIVVTLTFS